MSKNRNIHDSYQKYLEITDEPTNIKTYKQINDLYMKFLCLKVMEGNSITLPARLGVLSIMGQKHKVKLKDGKLSGLAPDWVKTKELWKKNPEAKAKKQLMYHTNSHTDGVRYKWFWSKRNVLIENKTLYALKMTRANKRAVHQTILDGNQYKVKN